MKEDPCFVKYWKMKVIKLPDGAIQHAMMKDGLDPSLLDTMDWEYNYEEQKNGTIVKQKPAQPTTSTSSSSGNNTPLSSGPPMKDDPRFVKYWKMKVIKLPKGAIQHTMIKDSVDPALLDTMDWEYNYEDQKNGTVRKATITTTAGDKYVGIVLLHLLCV